MEQAQSYYLQSSKQVRMHRDQLTPSHQELKIRHQFKLGFYAEMRMDLNTAVKLVKNLSFFFQKLLLWNIYYN